MRKASIISMFITLFMLLAGCSHDHHDDTNHHVHAEDDSKKKSKNTHQDISNQSL